MTRLTTSTLTLAATVGVSAALAAFVALLLTGSGQAQTPARSEANPGASNAGAGVVQRCAPARTWPRRSAQRAGCLCRLAR